MTMKVPVHKPTRRRIQKNRALLLTCPVSMADPIGYRAFIMESGVLSKANVVGKVVLE